ncbi:amino acid transporter, putative [Plasmodium berghei]|uniref:Putative amino acid transporter AAT1 n=2 Tax=Plasmodium berghei TaxID=5821 RepID=AAT1_PLABA|nr:amino acid transporter AAT1, putative [Plasmodium berghei ANKA]CXI65930.1 amino acid transporter, putative [Plasmodium berghei]SCM23995.1 amino acid transporter, putative [Plasmodium berghei]SCN26874.1 amino acid transporter, putative [Plasmodium berghei]SCO61275.1 amino acid transporter, putative [Plasmodium berghei]SCO63295.1 amino acid transporter, putative [Plasmodium berghei]|eukprot:XP_034422490.1 amino acid transporter AAT1, putative [Plasmodium berghei ANKA]
MANNIDILDYCHSTNDVVQNIVNYKKNNDNYNYLEKHDDENAGISKNNIGVNSNYNRVFVFNNKRGDETKQIDTNMESITPYININSLESTKKINLVDESSKNYNMGNNWYHQNKYNNKMNNSKNSKNSHNKHISIAHIKYDDQEINEKGKNKLYEENQTNTKKTWKRRAFSPFTPGGVRSSTVLFLCTAIGVGLLSIPYVFSELGIILSIILILLNSLESYITTNILCMSSLEHNIFVYGNLLEKIGNKYYKTLIDFGLTFSFLSGYVLVLILVNDYLSNILYTFNFPSFISNRIFITIVICLLVLPLTFREHIGSINCFLVFSLFSITLTVLAVGYQSKYYMSLLPEKNISLFKINKHFFKCFNILLFSFSQQSNACFITGQFNQPTQRRVTKSESRSILIQVIFYTLFGLLGYLSFLNTTKDNIILNYEETNMSILLCKFFLCISFFFSIPLNFIATYPSMISLYTSIRNKIQKLYSVLFTRNEYLPSFSNILRYDTENPFDEYTLDENTENSSTSESQGDDMFQRKCAAIFVTCLCAFVEFNVSKLSNFIGIFGGFTSSIISCILPNLIYYKNMHTFKNKIERYATLALLCFFSVIGLISSIVTAFIIIY